MKDPMGFVLDSRHSQHQIIEGPTPFMLRITVMNTKGGCGKTTIATNLASYCAALGRDTVLRDFDRQACSTRWLEMRDSERPHIHGVAAFKQPSPGMTRAWQMQLPAGTHYVINDTPAGYAGIDFGDRVAESDAILIPVLPSSIDIQTTADFIQDLMVTGKSRLAGKRLAFIINRNRIRTRAADNLDRFLQSLNIPVISRIRDTQHYVGAAEQGLGVHELDERDARKDTPAWEAILDWLDQPDNSSVSSTIPVETVLQNVSGA